MKSDAKYIALVLSVFMLILYCFTSCSNLLENDIKIEDLEGKRFTSEEGNKIYFYENNITLFFNEKRFVFNDYVINIDNMITLKTDEIDFEEKELRIYLLKDNSIFFTLDNQYYYW